MTTQLYLAICQMRVDSDKKTNIDQAEEMIKRAAGSGAEVIVLPEVFNAPYQTDLFPQYSECYPGPSTDFLARQASNNNVCIVGGSIIEKDATGNIYNTSFVFDNSGNLIGRHRKIHLFDVNLPGRMTFKESDTLTAGSSLTLFGYKSISFGLMICYDIRFPELSRATVLEGAQVLVIPAAFNLTSGPAHWELLMRSRAVDNQVFVVAASPARNTDASYQAWGHSMIVDPWGNILAKADEREEIIMAKLDFASLKKVREELPLLKQRRQDLYQLNYKNANS